MSDIEATKPGGPRSGGASSVQLEISNTIVGLHKRFFGRGPTKARATLERNLLVVVLEGGFSQAERTLAESGRADTVDETRHAMREVVRDEWISAVEKLLRRRVRSFLSANDTINQIQVETFVLWPEDAGSDGHVESARLEALMDLGPASADGHE